MVTQHTVVQHTVENILVWSFMHIDLHFIVEGRTFLRTQMGVTKRAKMKYKSHFVHLTDQTIYLKAFINHSKISVNKCLLQLHNIITSNCADLAALECVNFT